MVAGKGRQSTRKVLYGCQPVSWPLGVAACCQDVSSLIIRELTSQGLSLISYINDIGSVANTEAKATSHFNSLHTLLWCLSMQEAIHNAQPPLQVMTWLRLRFDSINMTVTIPEEKMDDNMQLVNSRS